MGIKNLYQFTIYNTQKNITNSAREEDVIYCDSDDINQLIPLPNDTIFVSCEKWDEEDDDFILIKNYAFGKELNEKDLNDELARATDSKSKAHIQHIIKYNLPKNKGTQREFCIFKNRDKVCVYKTYGADCEFLPENLINGSVADSDYSGKDYLDLE